MNDIDTYELDDLAALAPDVDEATVNDWAPGWSATRADMLDRLTATSEHAVDDVRATSVSRPLLALAAAVLAVALAFGGSWLASRRSTPAAPPTPSSVTVTSPVAAGHYRVQQYRISDAGQPEAQCVVWLDSQRQQSGRCTTAGQVNTWGPDQLPDLATTIGEAPSDPARLLEVVSQLTGSGNVDLTNADPSAVTMSNTLELWSSLQLSSDFRVALIEMIKLNDHTQVSVEGDRVVVRYGEDAAAPDQVAKFGARYELDRSTGQLLKVSGTSQFDYQPLHDTTEVPH